MSDVLTLTRRNFLKTVAAEAARPTVNNLGRLERLLLQKNEPVPIREQPLYHCEQLISSPNIIFYSPDDGGELIFDMDEVGDLGYKVLENPFMDKFLSKLSVRHIASEGLSHYYFFDTGASITPIDASQGENYILPPLALFQVDQAADGSYQKAEILGPSIAFEEIIKLFQVDDRGNVINNGFPAFPFHTSNEDVLFLEPSYTINSNKDPITITTEMKHNLSADDYEIITYMEADESQTDEVDPIVDALRRANKNRDENPPPAPDIVL